MKAKVTSEFRTLIPGDKKNSTVRVGEILDGALAETAVANGFAKQVADDTPMAKPLGKSVAAAPAPAPAAKPVKGGKASKKPEPEPDPDADGGGSGDGDEGEDA